MVGGLFWSCKARPGLAQGQKCLCWIRRNSSRKTTQPSVVSAAFVYCYNNRHYFVAKKAALLPLIDVFKGQENGMFKTCELDLVSPFCMPLLRQKRSRPKKAAWPWRPFYQVDWSPMYYVLEGLCEGCSLSWDQALEIVCFRNRTEVKVLTHLA